MRLNEGIDIKIVYCDDTPSEYIDDVTMNDIYDILDSSSDICKIVDVSGSKKKVVWTDEYGFERVYESKKSIRKSMKESTEITEPRMAWISLLNHVCNFGKWVSKTFGDKLFNELKKKNPREKITLDEFVDECEKFIDMTKIKGLIEDYLGNDKQIEDALKMYGLWNFSDRFAELKKSMKESFDGIYATSDMVGKNGKEWLLEGSYNFVMEFLEDWGIAPFSTKTKDGKIYLYDHDGGEYGFYTDEDGALINITDESTNYAWKNNLNRISTKRVKVYEV